MTMREPRVSEDFVPVSVLKARASEWLRRLAANDAPIVITQNGKPAGVLLSPSAFDELMESMRFKLAVAEGSDDVAAGRATPHDAVVKRMGKRHRKRR